ncbi:hypothetical protein QQF64_033877 [Cirrhinus molitorella]|uniref:Uncharacterized protein n=1 Tax=Cirrhinus molitorella TaxID=172907 RepID=A0ABR3MV80_9TELE
MVWCGIWDTKIVGPFFINGNLKATGYLKLLHDDVFPSLCTEAGTFPEFFQQDGAPPHYGCQVRAFLDEQFPEKWIGRRGPVEWPPRSHDLTHLDFYLWGHLKAIVYGVKIRDVQHLKLRILEACAGISPAVLLSVCEEWEKRSSLAVQAPAHSHRAVQAPDWPLSAVQAPDRSHRAVQAPDRPLSAVQAPDHSHRAVQAPDRPLNHQKAGGIGDTAAWMTNIGNELGQVLNSVLTTTEGAGLEECRETLPECWCTCGAKSFSAMEVYCKARYLPFYENCGVTTEHHPLYAKRGEWKSSHGGQAPTEAQLMASISPGELAKHCRRRTRKPEEIRTMISGLRESVWELTDTTGLRLVNPDSMRHVWEMQPKHLEFIQDPPHVELYTKTGTLQKGGKVLNVLRCGRGSSSLESFHRHQCAFIPGWRCNAMHTQMYMLEGASRWNMSRAKEAVSLVGASTLRTFDVRLMSHLNNMSQRVLGWALMPELTPPGKPTGERIAVEYLLAQSNRGDQLNEDHSDLPEVPPEEPEDEIDTTVCHAADLRADDSDPPAAVVEA